MRVHPRVDVQTFCSEIVAGAERPAVAVDLGLEGLRLERPYTGGKSPREIVLELEVPEVDEVIWTKAIVCYDRIRPAPRGVHGGPFGFLRTTGLRIVAAATRDLRLLRDCVYELRRARSADRVEVADLLGAACYARG